MKMGIVLAIVAAVAVCGGSAAFVLNDSASNETPDLSFTLEQGTGGTASFDKLDKNYYSLTATPDSIHVFKGWYENNRLVSSSSSCNISINKETTIKAVFEDKLFNVDISQNYKGGEITETGGKTYGSTVIVSTTVYPGFVFEGWYNGNMALSTSDSYSFKLTKDTSVQARYSVDHTISFNIAKDSVGAPANLTASFGNDAIKSYTLTYVLNETGYSLPVDTGTVYAESPGDYSFTAAIEFVDGQRTTVDSSISLEQAYTITFESTVGGSCNGMSYLEPSVTTSVLKILKGQTYRISAEAEYGYDFTGWILDHTIYTTTNTAYGVVCDGRDMTIKATFTPHIYTYTYHTNYSGVKSFSMTGTGAYNTPVSMYLVSNPGYSFEGYYLDGVRLSDSEIYDYTITKDVDIELRFGLIHDAYFEYSKSAYAPFDMTISQTYHITDAEYTLSVYDTWNDKSLYSEKWNGTDKVPVKNYGILSMNMTVTYADGTVSSYDYSDVFVDQKVTHSYSWKYKVSTWYSGILDSLVKINNRDGSFTYDLKFSDYYEAVSKKVDRGPRNMNKWVDFVQYNDPYVVGLAKYFTDLMDDHSELEKMNCVLKSVQSFSYTYDIDQFGEEEYFQYPIQMLWNQTGDCEDHAILFAAIAKAMGYNLVLYYLETSDAGHAAVGLDIGASGSYTTYNGVKYYYCEATSIVGKDLTNAREIGSMPSDLVIKYTVQVP